MSRANYVPTPEERALITLYRRALFQLGHDDTQFAAYMRQLHARMLHWDDLRCINYVYHIEGLAYQDKPVAWAETVVLKAISMRLTQ